MVSFSSKHSDETGGERRQPHWLARLREHAWAPSPVLALVVGLAASAAPGVATADSSEFFRSAGANGSAEARNRIERMSDADLQQIRGRHLPQSGSAPQRKRVVLWDEARSETVGVPSVGSDPRNTIEIRSQPAGLGGLPVGNISR